MQRLKQLLTSHDFSLIVSLPENNIEVVHAAKEAGTDAIKVHMNLKHRASGTSFGSLKENKVFFEQLHKVYQGITGIVPGDHPSKIIREEIQLIKDLGFDFISIYAHAAPAWIVQEKVTKMIALSSRDEELIFNHSFEFTDVVEVSILSPETYGSPLTIHDLWKYQVICKSVSQPVVIPTQKYITVDDLPLLKNVGAKAIMIGAIVTGNTPEGVYHKTKLYKDAIKQMRRN